MKKLYLLSFLLLLLFIQPVTGQSYVIDAGHSSITSAVQRFGAVDVIGRFNDVQGEIQYNKDDIASTMADVVIKVDSYVANNVGGEDAVKSEAFLHSSAFPEITFKVKGIKTEGDGHIAMGDLTIHGTTNQIELPFEVIGPVMDPPSRKQSIAVVGSITINRQDYGVSFDRKFPNGTEVVSNMVKINLNVLAIAKE